MQVLWVWEGESGWMVGWSGAGYVGKCVDFPAEISCVQRGTWPASFCCVCWTVTFDER